LRRAARASRASNVRGPRTVQKRMGGILINIRDLAHRGSSKTHDCLARCADVARTHFEKGAEMTQTRCENNLQAFGGLCFAPGQTDHRCAAIGRHQRASGGKTAHEGNAPQRPIDRHGHLDCPHRGREAGSSRSVVFPQLGGRRDKELRLPTT